jgi:hypothetical protein
MHPINPDECDVYSSLLDSCKSGLITPCVNHCMSMGGDIEGFRFTCEPTELAHCLPVNRKMFFRTSMVECNTCDSRVSNHNNLALAMLLDHETVLSKLVALVQNIHHKSVGNEASFDCMPDNLDHIHTVVDHMTQSRREQTSEPLLGSFMCRRATDCKVLHIALCNPSYCSLCTFYVLYVLYVLSMYSMYSMYFLCTLCTLCTFYVLYVLDVLSMYYCSLCTFYVLYVLYVLSMYYCSLCTFYVLYVLYVLSMYYCSLCTKANPKDNTGLVSRGT